MTKQPEALRLADALQRDMDMNWPDFDNGEATVAELRRLHAETTNQQDWLVEWRKCEDELKRLHEVNQELLKAYRKMYNAAAGYSNYCEESASVRRCERDFEEADAIFRAAIAKGEQP